MIKNENEYKKSIEQLKLYENNIRKHREHFEEQGYSKKEIEKLLEPSIVFLNEIKSELEYYENLCRKIIKPEFNFKEIGKFLIAMRIYKGYSQAELAKLSGVSSPQVSRDETNEYHNATLSKINRVLDILKAHITVRYTACEENEDAGVA